MHTATAAADPGDTAMDDALTSVMRLMQFSDSALPTGSFSFSCGLEAAVSNGSVRDAATLESFAETTVQRADFTEAVAAQHAFRAFQNNDYESFVRADRALFLMTFGDENRLMLTRTGSKLADLAEKLCGDDPILVRWKNDIDSKHAPGTYPIAKAALFALSGLSDKDLFYSLRYGLINTVLNAALRLIRVSHYETQSILFRLGAESEARWQEVRRMSLKDMHAFSPLCDIFFCIHEHGKMRMFMN